MSAQVMQGVVYHLYQHSNSRDGIGLAVLRGGSGPHVFSIFKVPHSAGENGLVSKYPRPYAGPSYARGGLAASYYFPTQCHMTRPKHGNLNKQQAMNKI